MRLVVHKLAYYNVFEALCIFSSIYFQWEMYHTMYIAEVKLNFGTFILYGCMR